MSPKLPAVAALALAGAWLAFSRSAQAAVGPVSLPTPQPTPLPTGIPEIDEIIVGGQHIDMDILARTAWAEARGEGYVGMQAVVNVIMNRYRVSKSTPNTTDWWGETVYEICTKRTFDSKAGKWVYQFSCWGDGNAAQAMAVTPADPQFRMAQEIALKALSGLLQDVTFGAVNYHASYVSPSWANPARRTTAIGGHIFYA